MPDNMTNSIFKYQPVNIYTLRNLKKKHVYILMPQKTFNDPFDCYAFEITDEISDDDYEDIAKVYEDYNHTDKLIVPFNYTQNKRRNKKNTNKSEKRME